MRRMHRGRADEDLNASTPCTMCANGSFASPASTACDLCVPGWSDSDSNAATPCSECPRGQYSSLTGRIGGCDNCIAGRYGLHPQTRMKTAANNAQPASTRATDRQRASRAPPAQPMLMKIQALHAAPARTARTQAVVEQHAARVSGARSTQTQILRLRVLSARPGSPGRTANFSLNHTNRMHASQRA